MCVMPRYYGMNHGEGMTVFFLPQIKEKMMVVWMVKMIMMMNTVIPLPLPYYTGRLCI